MVAELRERYDLLDDLPAQMEDEIVPFYRDSVENGVFPLDGGTAETVPGDLAFYAIGGQIEGDPESLDPDDFWLFEPLERARAALGDG